MRVIIVNPNTSDAVTALLLREARLAAADETEVYAVTARSGGQRASDAVVEAHRPSSGRWRTASAPATRSSRPW